MKPNESIVEMFTRFTYVVNRLGGLRRSVSKQENMSKVLRYLCDGTLRCTRPDPTRRPNLNSRTLSSLFFFFESFRIIQIQLIFQTQFKYLMKIYIRKYHFNIKGAHHLITKLFFHSMWHFMPIWSISHLYNMRHY